jgi:hypothetical protein
MNWPSMHHTQPSIGPQPAKLELFWMHHRLPFPVLGAEVRGRHEIPLHFIVSSGTAQTRLLSPATRCSISTQRPHSACTTEKLWWRHRQRPHRNSGQAHDQHDSRAVSLCCFQYTTSDGLQENVAIRIIANEAFPLRALQVCYRMHIEIFRRPV